jgi:hypothetical protein
MEAPAIHPAGGIADIQQNEVTSTRNQKKAQQLVGRGQRWKEEMSQPNFKNERIW